MDRSIEPDWQELARRLAETDVRKMAEVEADTQVLTGWHRLNFIAAYMVDHASDIEAEAALHIANVLDVQGWRYVGCPVCARAQWVKLTRSVLERGKLLGGQGCADCGKWLDERTWKPLVHEVHAPPDFVPGVDDEDEQEELEGEREQAG